MKSYKSLDSYNFLISGWVVEVNKKQLQDRRTLMLAKVGKNLYIYTFAVTVGLGHATLRFHSFINKNPTYRGCEVPAGCCTLASGLFVLV